MVTVYNKRGYLDVVDACAKSSMLKEVKDTPDYSTSGKVNTNFLIIIFIVICQQWVITDARHDSTANAYNTTVPCLPEGMSVIV